MFLLIRRPITLIEMLVVMAILALVAGIVGIGVSKAVVDQRFRTEVGLIVDEMRLAQDLMLVLGTDVRLKFQQNSKEGIDFWMELETTVKDSLQHEIIKKHHLLKTIRGVFFHDKDSDDNTEGKLEIRFLSKGLVMSRGIMRLATSDQDNPPPGVLQTYIPLIGYPGPIKSFDDLKFAEEAMKEYDNPTFDQTLTNDTFSKLPDKMKEKEKPKDSKASKEGEGEKDKTPNQPPSSKPTASGPTEMGK